MQFFLLLHHPLYSKQGLGIQAQIQNLRIVSTVFFNKERYIQKYEVVLKTFSGYPRKLIMSTLTYGRASGSWIWKVMQDTVTGQQVPYHLLRRRCNPSMVLLHEGHLMNFGSPYSCPQPCHQSPTLFNLFPSPSLLYLLQIVFWFPSTLCIQTLCHVIFQFFP